MFDLFESFFVDDYFLQHDAGGWDSEYVEQEYDWFSDSLIWNWHTDFACSDDDSFFADLLTSYDSDGLQNMNNVIGETTEGFAFFDFGNLWDDIWTFVEPIFFPVMSGDMNLVGAEQFTHDGTFDPINQCIVVGDVANDISFIQAQTGPTCSLMAQEQFIARMTGNHIPEAELERIATEMGVYDPIGGTFSDGWNAILDYFGVSNTSYFDANTDMLDAATQGGDDVLIAVDARVFYNDPTLPPGSGHAVTIVGRGIDPGSGKLNGYYITDSNCPGQAHFKTVTELEQSWDSHIVTVPTSVTA